MLRASTIPNSTSQLQPSLTEGDADVIPSLASIQDLMCFSSMERWHGPKRRISSWNSLLSNLSPAIQNMREIIIMEIIVEKLLWENYGENCGRNYVQNKDYQLLINIKKIFYHTIILNRKAFRIIHYKRINYLLQMFVIVQHNNYDIIYNYNYK